MAVHIFWDNSNVLGGLDAIRKKVEPDVPWVALRAFFPNIYDLVANGREVKTKIMVGSLPPDNDDLWNKARELGFNTDLLQRVDSFDAIGKVEQGVDEMLHLKIANAILDYDAPQTLAILSGDSSLSDYSTSFPTQAKRALKNGWDVEIYAAKDTISYNKYKTLLSQNGTQIRIIELDPYYLNISFVIGGYYYRYEEGKKIDFKVKYRTPKRLK